MQGTGCPSIVAGLEETSLTSRSLAITQDVPTVARQACKHAQGEEADFLWSGLVRACHGVLDTAVIWVYDIAADRGMWCSGNMQNDVVASVADSRLGRLNKSNTLLCTLPHADVHSVWLYSGHYCSWLPVYRATANAAAASGPYVSGGCRGGHQQPSQQQFHAAATPA